MCTVKNAADFFLSLQSGDAGDAISPMKLQKLLYYAQGFALALLRRPLFQDDFEAWDFGPVVREIYDEYRKYGNQAIDKPEDFSFAPYSLDEKDLLNQVYDAFGQYSAWALSEMTHNTPPWKDTQRNHIISKESMQRYFQTQVIE